MQAEAGTPLTDDAPSPSRHKESWPRGRRHLLMALGIAACVYGVDQLTKWWAQTSLTPGRPRDLVDGVLRLDLTHNAGAAFSVATGYTVVLTIVAIAVVVVVLRVAGRLGSARWAVALGLLLGGAVGNLSDRIFRAPGPFRGHVVDFLRLPHWPIFNVADTAVCAAAALLVLLSLLGVRLDGSRHLDEAPPKSQ